jgi:flagellar biosynthetic protein FlhB
MQEQDHSRTEQATPHKLHEAKKRGEVAKSLDVNSLGIIAGMLLSLSVWGASEWQRLCGLCAMLFSSAGSWSFETATIPAVGGLIAKEVLAVMLPFAAIGVVFAILSNLLQTGPIMSADPIKPKFERLNPVAGFKRVFNIRMLLEGLKSVIKLAVFMGVAYGFFRGLWVVLPQIAGTDANAQAAWFADKAMTLLFRLLLVLVLIALIDLIIVRRRFKRQMMMSHRDIKEEIKRREGDPHIRAKIRELQRENRKQAKSLGRVPEADVLITNPEHLAIALRYERGTMGAPLVIAKGADAWAAQMRASAVRHGIPRIEQRRLARLLFRRSVIDQPIPAETFLDVARIYAQLGAEARNRARYEVHA